MVTYLLYFNNSNHTSNFINITRIIRFFILI